jgi:hypothetical protein
MVDRAALPRRRERVAVGVEPADVRILEPRTRGKADRAADQADAEDG